MIKRVLLAVLGCMAIGCGTSPEDRVIGVWSADMKNSSIPNVPVPGQERNLERYVEGFVLKLRSDKTFAIASIGSVGGTWKLEGNTVKLTPNRGNWTGPMGVVLTDVEAEVEADYSRLKIEQPTPLGPVVLVLRKTA